MKLNTAWLLKYLDTPIPHRDLIDAMPRAGLEVEAEIELKTALEPVVIGFVREKTPIADAPGMFATQVEIEKGKRISVLVGSEHEVKVGWGVPIAPAGVTLPTGKKVAAGKFHGVESNGMICLDGEMGLIARGTGMHWWTDESVLGNRFVDLVDIPEYLIELKVLPNRPDCLGVLGISRELAAIFDVKTKWPEVAAPTVSGGQQIDVEIREPELCKRFTAAPFTGVKVGPSPGWLKCVLLTAGMRPINNVVDITNFVMWETGQPSHAFDLNKLAGKKIVVRKLGENEQLTLLTGKTIDRKYGQPLCVCDADKPQGLAGIMGGAEAETAEATTDVLLEVAYFDPVHVRNNVKTLRRIDGAGGTDASYRFERGVDPNIILDWARFRAYQLITELAGGKLAAQPTDVYPKRVEPREFRLTEHQVSRMVGMRVTHETIQQSLTKLGYIVSESLTVTVPTHRVDVNDPCVLIEDVARMIGYDNIPAADEPAHATRGQASRADVLRTTIARTLVGYGWYETKNDPLESEQRTIKWLGKPADGITLQNAATAEMSVLRRSLITGLAASAQRNIFRGATAVKLFEIDRTFATLPGAWTLGGIVGGALQRVAWRGGEQKVDFFTAKGDLEDLLEQLGIRNVRFLPTLKAPLRQGEAAQLQLPGGETIGCLGELDTSLIKIERQPYKLFVFEIDLEKLLPHFAPPITYTPVNKLPASTRDLAIVVETKVPYAELDETIRSTGGGLLEHLQLVDEYRGQPVPKDHRSLAFRLTFRDPSRTLTADEVTAVVDRIVTELKGRFGATLRA